MTQHEQYAVQNGRETAPERGDMRTLLCVLYMTVCTMSNLYAPQPLLNVISLEFGTEQASTALVISASLLPLAVAPVLYGPLISRISIRRILVGACFLFALCGAGMFVCTSYSMLLTLRMLEGLLFPAVFTSLMTYLSSQYQGQELQRVMAAYIGCTVGGGFLGRMLAGGLSSLFGWRLAVLLVTLMPLLGIWGLLRLPAEHKSGGRWHHYGEYIAGLREPGVASIVLIDVLTFFVFTGINNFLPFRMAELGHGNSEFLIGLMYAGYILGVAASFSSRTLGKICGGPVMVVVFGLLPYFPLLFFMSVPNTMVMFVSLCVICAGHFAAYSNLPGLLNRLATLDKAMVNGLFVSCHYIGGTLGAWLPGYTYKALGWNANLVIFAGLIALAILLAWRVRTMPAIRN